MLSGQGLARLHARLAGAHDVPRRRYGTVFARAAGDPAAARAVDMFTAVLGRIAGDLALATCAWGGVYLCGSVAVAWAGDGRCRAISGRIHPQGSHALPHAGGADRGDPAR